MPGSHTEIGPWRNSSGSYAAVATWLVSVSFRPHSAAIPYAGPPPRTTIRLQSVAPRRRPVRGRRGGLVPAIRQPAQVGRQLIVGADACHDPQEQGEHAGE